MDFVVTCMPGVSAWLEGELRELGLEAAAQGGAAVTLNGRVADALTVCLWSRLAERVMLPLASTEGDFREVPAALAQTLDWPALAAPGQPVHVHADHRGVPGDSRVSARNFLRAAPSSVTESDRPAGALCLRLDLHEQGGTAFLDLAGEPLHRRGYRLAAGEAPLRETLAAALLRAAGWGADDRPPVLLDPFCGSGTILIEAAAMAMAMAPGLDREEFGFRHWRGCPSGLWQQLCEQAREKRRQEPADGLSLKGFDADAGIIPRARDNARRAGVDHLIHFERRELGLLRQRDFAPNGLVVTNPPWGERLETRETAAWLHASLGRILASRAPDWSAVVPGSEVEVLDRAGMQLQEQWRVRNGPLNVFIRRMTPVRRAPEPVLMPGEAAFDVEAGAVDLFNRLRKNGRRLKRWVEQEGIQAYRLYDRDLPEFNVSVDVYGNNVLVQEFAAPSSIPEETVAQRRAWAISAVRAALGAHREQVFLRTRQRQKGKRQYQRLGGSGRMQVIREGDAHLLVNLRDYLDTGLFLDHRPMRLRLGAEAAGKRVLNLFGYTGAATVHAAVGGAARSVTVDSSRRYLDWAGWNLALNGFSTRHHRLERADTMKWLVDCREQFDLVFCDPPTFSNSKSRRDFAVQEHHAELIRLIMKRLEPGGVLYFSCNFRRFKLDESITRWYAVEDISRWSLPPDFQRNSGIHHCFRIRDEKGDNPWKSNS